MKRGTTFLLGIASMFWAVLPIGAQREISSFEDIQMQEGENRYGAEMQLPDQYLELQPDGTYKARRLTVTPATQEAACTAPYLQMLTDSSVYVCWKTSTRERLVRVHYCMEGEEMTLEARPTVEKLGEGYFWNRALLTGLRPSAAYTYQVVRSGGQVMDGRFRTLDTPAEAQRLRVLVIGDHQRNDRSDYEWLCRAAERTAREKWGQGSLADHVQFLLNVGDQVDGGYLSLYENVHLFKSRLYSSSLPTMTCVGNHDGYGDSGYRLYSGHYPYVELSYRNIASGTSAYYAYQAGRTLFVVLNSDGVSPAQTLWLRRVMAAADRDNTVDFIVSVQHRPLYAEQYSGDYSDWTLHTVMPIMQTSPKFVLNLAGHHHLFARGQMTDAPVYHIITGGGVGTSAQGYEQLWGETPDNRDWDEVQKTIDQWTYQLLEFDYTRGLLTVETYALGNRRLAQDNVLVDRFTRCLKEETRPARPVLAEIPERVELPCVFAQQTDTLAYATQFQVATDEAFTQVALDRVITCENLYGVDDKFLPLDIQGGHPTSRLQVETGQLQPGQYYIRTRNRNHNLMWSDFSQVNSFTVAGEPVAEASVATDRYYWQKGANVEVRYAGAPVGRNAWVGIYHSDWTGEGASVAWCYIQDAEGTCSFRLTDEGAYMAVLYADEGHDEIARSRPFVVSNSCSEDNPCQLTVEDRYLPVGRQVKVRYRNMPATGNNWVGVYRSGQEPRQDVSLSWCYVTGTSGEVSLDVPASEDSYYVQYFLRGEYSEVTDRVPFMVGNGVQLDVLQSVLGGEDEAMAIYEGVPSWEPVEMVVTDTRGTEVCRVPMGDASGGSLSLGYFQPGSYTCQVVACATGTSLSRKVTFHVGDPTSLPAAVRDGETRVCYDAGWLCVRAPQGSHRVNVTSLDGRAVSARSFVGEMWRYPLPLPGGIYLVCVDRGEACKVVVR